MAKKAKEPKSPGEQAADEPLGMLPDGELNEVLDDGTEVNADPEKE
jgi:hypothetical protein